MYNRITSLRNWNVMDPRLEAYDALQEMYRYDAAEAMREYKENTYED